MRLENAVNIGANRIWKVIEVYWMLYKIPDGRCPSERMTTASSVIVIDPSSSLSNSMNTSLNSVFFQELSETNETNIKIVNCYFIILTLNSNANDKKMLMKIGKLWYYFDNDGSLAIWQIIYKHSTTKLF